MAKKLKSYQTSIGFFDLAVAAPSMKAALEAWGSGRNLFTHGLAREADDPAVVAATMAKPGIVLKRPVGSDGPFKEQAALPRVVAPEETSPKPAKPALPGREADGKAVLAAKKEQERREKERRTEEAKLEKERQRRAQVIAKAEAALDAARARHAGTVQEIAAQREALETKARAEDARWESERAKLEAALKSARG